MRSKLLFLMLAAILLAGSVQGNMVVNSDFEFGTWTSEEDVPDDWWLAENAQGGDGKWKQNGGDQGNAHSGTKFMYLDGSLGQSGNQSRVEIGQHMTTAVTEGQDYYWGVYHKDSPTIAGGGQYDLDIRWYSAAPTSTTDNGSRSSFQTDTYYDVVDLDQYGNVYPPNGPTTHTGSGDYETVPAEWTKFVVGPFTAPAGATHATPVVINWYADWATWTTGAGVLLDDMYFGTTPFTEGAVNVYPPDGAEYILPSAVLEWGPPSTFDPNAYDVYFTTDPNANKPEHLVVDGKLQTTYDPPGNMGFNTTYYWRVNSYDPCCTEPSCWPLEGGVWSFTTMPAEPVFTTDAAHTVVAVGGSAEFSVVSPNATLGFKWYKEPATLLSDGDDGGDISIVSDATSSTLTISDVEAADEDFYYCVAENSYDTTESAHAKLAITALLAHWTLDSPLVANQYADETGNHDADPNNPSGVSFTTGIIGGALGAVEMNNEKWANAGNWRPNEHGGQMTVSAWVKVPDTDDIDGDGQGIVSKRVGNDFDWAIYVRGGDGSHDGDNYVRFTSWNGGDVWAGPDAVDPETPDWVYVVATVDSDGAGRLYIDGVVQAVDDEWVFGTNESADMLIGKGTPTDYVFPGLIDDVKIYNYARDPYVIAADYTDVAGGSVCVQHRPGDYNGDCKVDLADIAEVALIWRSCNIIPASACP